MPPETGLEIVSIFRMDGACVLEEDADKFINEWKRLEATREERENKVKIPLIGGEMRLGRGTKVASEG